MRQLLPDQTASTGSGTRHSRKPRQWATILRNVWSTRIDVNVCRFLSCRVHSASMDSPPDGKAMP